MSRRTRLKMRKNQDNYGLGTNHHNEYASSITSFPKSYSPLGRQIRFPSTAVSFLSDGKLTFYGELQTFLQKVSGLEDKDFITIHAVNIGIKGKVEQNMSQLNNCIFAFSMILCCVSELFKTSFYRNNFFTKYSFELTSYKILIDFLKKLPNLQIIILNFQDNFLDREKFQFLDEALSAFRAKSITLRNLSYFIQPKAKLSMHEGQIDEFERIKKTRMEFIFVWQKQTLHYNSRQLQEQKQSIAASLCDQL